MKYKGLTMLPTSVEPRAQAKRMGLHPPPIRRENSFEVVPVWRTSMGPAATTLSRAAVMKVVLTILAVWWTSQRLVDEAVKD
jgi:hypothetical protein